MGKFDKLGKIIKVVGSSGDETAKALAAVEKVEPQLQRYFRAGDTSFPAIDEANALNVKNALEKTGRIPPGRDLIDLGDVDPEQFSKLRDALSPEMSNDMLIRPDLIKLKRGLK